MVGGSAAGGIDCGLFLGGMKCKKERKHIIKLTDMRSCTLKSPRLLVRPASVFIISFAANPSGYWVKFNNKGERREGCHS